jgi:hypothetical protein
MQVVNRLARGPARPIAWALCLGFIARAYSRSLLSGLISQGHPPSLLSRSIGQASIYLASRAAASQKNHAQAGG